MSEADRWAEWQRDHAAALAALQEAQRAYHRGIVAADLPWSAGIGQPSVRQQMLDALEAARARLDEVRTRMPR